MKLNHEMPPACRHWACEVDCCVRHFIGLERISRPYDNMFLGRNAESASFFKKDPHHGTILKIVAPSFTITMLQSRVKRIERRSETSIS
jgi:hypothetical protein